MGGHLRLTAEPGPGRLPAWAGVAGAASVALALLLPVAAPSATPDAGRVPSGSRTAAPAAATAHSPPVALTVPGHIGRMPVDPVGGTDDGALDLPASPSRLGWWALGARPGEAAGTLLLAGHLDSAAEGPGPFEALHSLPIGALAHVAAADGGRHTYRIVARRTYRSGELPGDLFSAEGAPRLVLVTCTGAFDPEEREYAENLVVYGVPA
ncbi:MULTISPECIES: class F sortase [Streptomyces]|uniref:Class F sortase n=1 Tax=Streptomyces sudanensis TaxID=436397 RepID=A0ABY4TGJ5_9ACTN|nr:MULTISPECIES: class F sortase [Streptomyces]MCP9958974.1 class F sortase [Streptomyces sudanensis]MCP9988043.1 class F sortase [Streptomyces sudanensis]MCQ0000551.1 class F sortase [Streptomyces sudanensis]URN16135.1 class F sortase [Streptomyces sudanensis]